MVRNVLLTLAFGSLALALACGDTSGPRSGLNIVSGAGLSDTVLSMFKPPLTIVPFHDLSLLVYAPQRMLQARPR